MSEHRTTPANRAASRGVGARIEELLHDDSGLTADEIARLARKDFPKSRATAAEVYWYASRAGIPLAGRARARRSEAKPRKPAATKARKPAVAKARKLPAKKPAAKKPAARKPAAKKPAATKRTKKS